MRKKSVEFLNACIEQIDKLGTSEVEKLKHIYEEEMERKTDVLVILSEMGRVIS